MVRIGDTQRPTESPLGTSQKGASTRSHSNSTASSTSESYRSGPTTTATAAGTQKDNTHKGSPLAAPRSSTTTATSTTISSQNKPIGFRDLRDRDRYGFRETSLDTPIIQELTAELSSRGSRSTTTNGYKNGHDPSASATSRPSQFVLPITSLNPSIERMSSSPFRRSSPASRGDHHHQEEEEEEMEYRPTSGTPTSTMDEYDHHNEDPEGAKLNELNHGSPSDEDDDDGDRRRGPPPTRGGGGGRGSGRTGQNILESLGQRFRNTKNSFLQASSSSAADPSGSKVKDPNRLLLILMGLIILVLVIVVFFMSLYLGNYEPPPPPPVCMTPTCLSTVTSLVSFLDTTASPCGNFYEYVCGDWQKSHRRALMAETREHRLDPLNELENRIERDLKHYLDLESYHSSSVSSALSSSSGSASSSSGRLFATTAKKFYSVCMAQEENDHEMDNAFRYAVAEARGWKILGTWTRTRWDRFHAMETLHTRYAVSTFFAISVGPDDFHPEQFTIKITPDGLGLPDKVYYQGHAHEAIKEAYRVYLTTVAKQFGALPNDAKMFVDQVYSFESRLADIHPSREALAGPLRRGPAELVKMSIRELNRRAPTVRWLNILQKMFPYAALTDQSTVLVAFPEYFDAFSNILTSGNDETIHNYLMWRMVSKYIGLLSAPFRMIEQEFRSTFAASLELSGSAAGGQGPAGQPSYISWASQASRASLREGEERWRYCIRTTNEYLGLALGAIYVERRRREAAELSGDYDAADELAVVRKMFDSLTRTITAGLEAQDWTRSDLTDHERNHRFGYQQSDMIDPNRNSEFGSNGVLETAKEKIRNLNPLIGYPANLLADHEQLNSYYADLVVQQSFFRNVEQAIHFRYKKWDDLLQAPVTDENLWRWSASLPSGQDPITPHSVRPVYHYAGNSLQIPYGLLQLPVYDRGAPQATKWGALGALMTNAILASLDPQGVLYSSHGAASDMSPSWLRGAANESYYETIACVGDLIGDSTGRNISDKLQLETAHRDIGTLKFSYRTFREAAESEPADLDLPALQLTRDQLFFISYGQGLCEVHRAESSEVSISDSVSASYSSTSGEGVNSQPVPAALRLQLAVRQSRAFERAFDCAKHGHRHRGRDSCKVWS